MPATTDRLPTPTRLGTTRLKPIDRIETMRAEGFGEDEIASLLTFLRGRMVEAPTLGSQVHA